MPATSVASARARRSLRCSGAAWQSLLAEATPPGRDSGPRSHVGVRSRPAAQSDQAREPQPANSDA